MTFESEGLLIVAIYIWLPPASYVVFLTTLVAISHKYLIKVCLTLSADLYVFVLSFVYYNLLLLFARTLFPRLHALKNLRENKVLLNKKCFVVVVQYSSLHKDFRVQ